MTLDWVLKIFVTSENTKLKPVSCECFAFHES